MNVFALQIMAVVTMLTDHVACRLMNNPLPLRCIGRFAFPLYAFLLAEGFRHIKNQPDRVDKHLRFYVVLTLVSEVCYDFMETTEFSLENLVSTQSCMITLFLAFLGLIAIERWKDNPPAVWSAILLTALSSFLMKSNFKFMGVILVYAFYYYLNHVLEEKWIKRYLCLLLIFAIYLPLYHWARYDFCTPAVFLEKLTIRNISWYCTHVLIALPLSFYNGKLGPQPRKFKQLYKVFYPLHLFVVGFFQLILK